MAWTQGEEILVKQMWAEGYSAAEVAAKLPGKTRNSVIGKVNRKGYVRGAGNNTRPKSERQQIRARQMSTVNNSMQAAQVAKKRAVAKGIAAPVVNQFAPTRALDPATHKGRRIGLLELEAGDCKFPTDYEGEHLFCGEATHEHNYCQKHRDLLGDTLEAQRARERVAREAEKTRLRNGTSAKYSPRNMRGDPVRRVA